MHDLRPVVGRRGRDELADQIEPGQLGHQVVDDEHVEEPLARSRCASRGLPVATHFVAFLAQRLRQRVADFRFVVDEQDGTGVAVMQLGVERQLDADLGPALALAGDGDAASEAFDDVAGDRKTDAGAGAAGREVGIEDPRQVFRRDAGRRGPER